MYLFHQGHQVSYLNVVRSGLSFFLSQLFPIGEDFRVKRLFRFFWKRRPVFPRYLVTWDVCKVLNYLASWHPPSSLSLKDLSLKTLALVAITSSDRAQTIEAIDVEHSEVTHEGIFFPIYSLLKCSKRGRPVKVVKCVRFEVEGLDVSEYVTAYLQRTFSLRARAVSKGLPKPRNLFLSYQTGKPLRRATISKYLLEVLGMAGVNTDCFKAHSTRAGAPSYQSARGASPGQILTQGDWKSLGVFRKFYDRFTDTSTEGKLIMQVARVSQGP